jgi:hypothetical protein
MTINERIHSAMADGLQLTENEKRLLKMSASELLALWLTIYARALRRRRSLAARCNRTLRHAAALALFRISLESPSFM